MNRPMPARYDTIGATYADLRRPDPRIAAAIRAALSPARTVVNVGAGTGSYEPADRQVTAIEPSATMIAQRAPDAAPAIQASAEALPFADGSFDAALAILTLHHWPDRQAGLRELRRVARDRVVILTYDPAARPWLTDYLPGLVALDEAAIPPLESYAPALGPVRTEPLPIPHDCSDGFLYAYWRRPEAYLDPHIRSGSSSFWALGDAAQPGLARLADDLATGKWHHRHGALLNAETYDPGYRLIITA